jgi:hypothetical protein
LRRDFFFIAMNLSFRARGAAIFGAPRAAPVSEAQS